MGMLNIWVGDYKGENVVEFSDTVFPDLYEDEWFEDPFVKEMILDVDQSVVVGPLLIQSPVLGPIAYSELSGGVKALILMYKMDEYIFNATNCGNNCAKWIQRISEKKDLTIKLEYVMEFQDDEYFNIRIMQTGDVAHKKEDYVMAYMKGKYTHEGNA